MRSSFDTGLEQLVEKVALALPAPVPTAALAPRPGLLSRAARPLALGGLAAAGALAAGLGSQYENDRKKYPLVYAPLQGAY